MILELGLIGYPLTHSFSPAFFKALFEREGLSQRYRYQSYPLEHIGHFKTWAEVNRLVGLNVTHPYKREILSHVDELDPLCEQIEAANTLVLTPNGWKAFNTDVGGFVMALEAFLGGDKPKGALVLGQGGAASAVKAGLDRLGIPHQSVGRRQAPLLFQDIDEKWLSSHPLLVHCTPLGTFPNTEQAPPLPYHLLNENHWLFDLVYNPVTTLFMKKGAEKGAKTCNGDQMLRHQAMLSWEIWQKHH